LPVCICGSGQPDRSMSLPSSMQWRVTLWVDVTPASRIGLMSIVPGAPAGAVGNAPLAGQPTEIRVTPPPGMDGKQTREWNKIFEEVEKGHFEGARHKLDDFEDRYGTTDQTRELRPQLDALGSDVRGPEHGPGGPHGRGKKHHDDD